MISIDFQAGLLLGAAIGLALGILIGAGLMRLGQRASKRPANDPYFVERRRWLP